MSLVESRPSRRSRRRHGCLIQGLSFRVAGAGRCLRSPLIQRLFGRPYPASVLSAAVARWKGYPLASTIGRLHRSRACPAGRLTRTGDAGFARTSYTFVFGFVAGSNSHGNAITEDGMAPGQRPPTAQDLGLMCVDRANGAGLATLENWQTAPWNRWSLQHMSEIIPSARISRSEGPILDLLADPQAVDLKGTSIPICHAASGSYSQISPPRTSMRRTLGTSGANLRSATPAGVRRSRPRCGLRAL